MNIYKLLTQISLSSKPQFWAGGVSGNDIRKSERTLGLSFPEEYKVFLEKFGAGSIGSLEIYGLGCPSTGVPNVEFVIEALNKLETSLPDGLLPIAMEDNGGYACLVCKQSHLGPLGCVVDFMGTSVEAKEIASSFAEYLETKI